MKILTYTGLEHFWSKVKSYIDTAVSSIKITHPTDVELATSINTDLEEDGSFIFTVMAKLIFQKLIPGNALDFQAATIEYFMRCLERIGNTLVCVEASEGRTYLWEFDLDSRTGRRYSPVADNTIHLFDGSNGLELVEKMRIGDRIDIEETSGTTQAKYLGNTYEAVSGGTIGTYEFTGIFLNIITNKPFTKALFTYNNKGGSVFPIG